MIEAIKRKDNTSLWLIYYIILGVIQAMWTNPSAFPPLPLRLAMNVAVFFPMLLRRECAIFGIPFFMILRGQLGTDYQYMPDIHSYNIYIPVILLLLIIHYNGFTLKYLKVYAPLIFFLVYMWVIDILGISECGLYVTNLFIAFIYSLLISSKQDTKILLQALVSVCAILAAYYIIMFDQFLETWDAAEGIERSGWNDPNYFSTLLGIGLLLATLVLLRYVKCDFVLFTPLTLIAIIILIYIAIILTASRAGFISSSVILLFALIKSRPKLSTIFFSVSLLTICLIVMYRLGIFDTLLYRMLEQDNLDTGGGRTTIWLRVVQNFGDQSIINQFFGSGYWHRSLLSGGAEMHNELIAIWADYGYVGAVIFIFMILSMLFNNYRMDRVRSVAVMYYILMIVSLSPFQYINVGFLLVWILSLKLTSDEVSLEE